MRDLTTALMHLREAIATQPEAVRIAVEAHLASVGQSAVERRGSD